MGLYSKLILVTQKQVLELYITVIEHKTLYGLCIPHTAFPNATKATTKEVHVTKDGCIRTSQQQDETKTTSTRQKPVVPQAELQEETLQLESPETEDTSMKQSNPINVQAQDIEENEVPVTEDTSEQQALVLHKCYKITYEPICHPHMQMLIHKFNRWLNG